MTIELDIPYRKILLTYPLFYSFQLLYFDTLPDILELSFWNTHKSVSRETGKLFESGLVLVLVIYYRSV